MSTERFRRFPAALASQTREVKIGDIPVLLAHPDWRTSAPVMLWMHGRTVSKELYPGRYLRWIRAGIAACAIDLPGHGQRPDETFQKRERSPELLRQIVDEIDRVVDALARPDFGGNFDLDRMGIGGMSAGGMATLRRLCDPHPFRCAAVEGTTGDLAALYGLGPEPTPPDERRILINSVDPARHLASWRPLPLLVAHSKADRIIPWPQMASFIERLRLVYRGHEVDPALIEVLTWPHTGAPHEHLGFGRYSNEAKNAQVDFLRRNLLG
jgi:dienelactone hydrolase